MPKRKQKTLRVNMVPETVLANTLVDRFSECFSTDGFEVIPFGRSLGYLIGIDIVILHWPDAFFSSESQATVFQLIRKLVFFRLARIILGQRVVWIAHDAVPHDKEADRPIITRMFFGELSGIVYLSKSSKDLINDLYKTSLKVPFVITRLGSYSSGAITPPVLTRSVREQIEVIFFGRLLPYKNVDLLIECFKKLPVPTGASLRILGFYPDSTLYDKIEALTAGTEIKVEVGQEPLPLAEIEGHVDGATCAVFPYRRILNSGSVLFALSRWRPVLAPRIGTLPELQSDVGSNWLHLYDGDLSPQILSDFIRSVRDSHLSHPPDLSRYDWTEIGIELRKFIRSLL